MANDFDLTPSKLAKIKCKYANRKPMQNIYFMGIVMFSLSVKVFEIFAVRIEDLDLTFIIGQDQMQICQSKTNMS